MTGTRRLRQLVAAGTAAVATAVAARELARHPPGGRERWLRTNHAGRQVSLLEGPAYVVGALAGAVTAGSPAGVVAVAGAAAFGALDDLVPGAPRKGLRGHLGALARGEVTTGAVKVVGLVGTGLAAAAALEARPGTHPGPGRGARLVRIVVAGAVVAGSANLANLLDLRPGRALKVAVIAGLPLAMVGSGSAASAVGAAAAALPGDLAGTDMLGDTGANAAGALVGVALLEHLGPRGRVAALVLLTGLTLASERVSFTQVIERTPGLRTLDAWGRATLASGEDDR